MTEDLAKFLSQQPREISERALKDEVFNGFLLGALPSGNAQVDQSKLVAFIDMLPPRLEDAIELVGDQADITIFLALNLKEHLMGFILGYLCPKLEGEDAH